MSRVLHFFKILVLGEPGVGKTSLVQRYVHNKFSTSYKMTIGIDPYSRDVEVEGGRVVLQILDIAGQERFAIHRPSYYKGSMAAILVFDLTRPQSLTNLQKWYDEFVEICQERPVIIFGNKSDLTDIRMVEDDEARNFAEKIGTISYLETSAKTNSNVVEAFDFIGNHLYENVKKM